ncbi:aKG-HExxH-type peptide beta-hydroxylase [Micromonospora rubida]|uniref:aKG-HExxH-type peptide beta-hydroxylase n=1 Tax=Micromonospora rubida TaxID=2697657 RepID=UPI001378EF8F|nr:HEXXH motif-containing putative peptide modification protein [Micromonospora rubida]NBE81487.1 hypothetical protein [Micromonospora rubida]
MFTRRFGGLSHGRGRARVRADRHEMPPGTFLAIARGGGGPSAVRRLLAGQYSRNLLALREVVELTGDLRHPHAELVRRAWHDLGELRRSAPQPARQVLTYPAVSAWVAQTLAALRAGDGPVAQPAMLGPVVAAAALRAGLPLRVAFPTGPTGAAAFALPTLGLVRPAHPPAPPGAHGGSQVVELAVDGADGTVAIDGVTVVPAAADRPGRTTGPGAEPGPPVWFRTPVLRAGGRAGLRLRLDDLGSVARPGAVVPVGPADAAVWRARLAPAWRLLATRHRRYAAELAAAVAMLMPLARDGAGRAALAGGGRDGTSRERGAGLVSGTFPAGVGCIALAGHGDAQTLAATLVHELAHNKLAALDDLFALVEPADGVRLSVPWRAGLRPLPALVQGLYAHVRVADFWRRQRHVETEPGPLLRAQVEFERVRLACRDVAGRLLAGDGLTPYGRLLVAQLDDVLAGWRGETVPRRAAALARRSPG